MQSRGLMPNGCAGRRTCAICALTERERGQDAHFGSKPSISLFADGERECVMKGLKARSNCFVPNLVR